MRSGGMLSAAVVDGCSPAARAPVSDVDARAPPPHGDVVVLGGGDLPASSRAAGRWGRQVPLAPRGSAAGTCLLNGGAPWRLLTEASQTLSSRGIARFIGDVVDALVKFTALSTTPADNQHPFLHPFKRALF